MNSSINNDLARLGDSEEVKRIYKEMAHLKTSIRRKETAARSKEFTGRVAKAMKKNRSTNLLQNVKIVLTTLTKKNAMNSEVIGTRNHKQDQDQDQDQEQYITIYSRSGTSLTSMAKYKQDMARWKTNNSAHSASHTVKKMNIAEIRYRTGHCDRVKINGAKYAVLKNGRVLCPLQTTLIPVEITWNRQIYTLTRNGHYRITTNKDKKKSKDACYYFTKTGTCQRGTSCKYGHNRSMIKLCPAFLKGECKSVNCLLSHSPDNHNTPLCRYNLEKRCTKEQCRYSHAVPKHYGDPKYAIWTCRPFAMGNWCPRGRNCPFLHVSNCPDFEEDGCCERGAGCRLSHRLTLHTQQLISTDSGKIDADESEVHPTSPKVLRNDTGTAQKEAVLITEGEHEKHDVDRNCEVISSYTVSPGLLFVTNTAGGNFPHYIDEDGDGGWTQKEYEPAPKTQFLIDISDDGSETDESDGFF
ncbi:uncharacterized protein LODBEIA_P08290 [Lodderomyces beijingensis]|uniref:C3H1-type domain-containing protein n=1 Tax=Lodderomyces beijingensis TaxID=1775926 RepID=A0ABP0ZHI2_9ASCO